MSLFAGLVVLADWIGSDERRFPVDRPHGPDREPLRRAAADAAIVSRGLLPLATPDADFVQAFGFEPRGIQTAADADDLGPVALIEAETGSGKTEAALWRWFQLRRRGLVDGLYFALPTRAAAVQLHTRVQTMLTRVWGDAAPQAVLAVPGYLRAGNADGQPLPGHRVRWDRNAGDAEAPDARWAAERADRFLAARVAVGTIDQALLGALKVRHAPVRAAALARSLLVVDEVHASDAYGTRLLETLLHNHVAVGGQALLLSATLGATARARLLAPQHAHPSGLPTPALADAIAQPYPALSGAGAPPRAVAPLTDDAITAAKPVVIEIAPIIADPDAIAARAIAAARAGASVLVIRNTVRGAVAVARAVEALDPDLAFRVNGVATAHHGRFAPSDRRLLDAAVETAFGKRRDGRGRVLVGTQTLEQSLDLDADLLLTDLAPIDVLLQRIGRLHRHPRTDRGTFADARVVVLRPAARDLSPLLGPVPDRHGLGPSGRDGRGVYRDLRQIESTLRLLEADPLVTLPADNRRLVEGALHPDVLAGIADALGTDWRNHDATIGGSADADRSQAANVALDLDTAFRDLTFPDGEAVATRLGGRDLLIDCDRPLTGPFGAPVPRLGIPHWMAGGIDPGAQPLPLGDAGTDGLAFRLGTRTIRYDRWGLWPVD